MQVAQKFRELIAHHLSAEHAEWKRAVAGQTPVMVDPADLSAEHVAKQQTDSDADLVWFKWRLASKS